MVIQLRPIKKAKQFYCTMTYNNTQTKHQDKERTKKYFWFSTDQNVVSVSLEEKNKAVGFTYINVKKSSGTSISKDCHKHFAFIQYLS